MSELRIIPVVFGGKHFIITDHRMQYDYGQVLDFRDLELPDSFEARFSNSPVGESIGQIGTNNRIRIPKQFFESGEPIYCYITLHDEVTDGRTIYTTKVPIKPSSERTEEEPEPEEESLITQAITALNTAVEKTAQDVVSADALVQAASEQADRAEQAAEGVEGYAERAEAAQSAAESARDRAVTAETSARTSAATATEKASEAISSAATASQSALTAESASESASASASASAESASASALSASQASASATTAGSKATEASGYASSANTSAQTASQKALEASQGAQTATQAKTDAESAKTASETAQGLAEQARNEAVTAKTDAESARDEAQSIADGITVRGEQIVSNTGRIESLEDDRYKPYPTDTASGSIASFPDGADDIPLKSCIVQIEPVQEGSGDPSPDNVRPISGWTGCEVQRTGVNLLALPVIRFSEGTATINDCFFVKQGTYTLSYSCTETHRFGVRMMDANGVIYTTSADTPMSGLSYNASAKCHYVGADIPSGSKTFTLTIKHDCYIRIVSNLTGGGFTDVQLELGSTATAYEPYTEQTYPITFPTSAGTVYGGYVDVINGELVVDRAVVDLGTLNLRKDTDTSITNYLYYATLPNRLPYYANNRDPVFLKCSALKPIEVAMAYGYLKTLEPNTVVIRPTYTDRVYIKSEIDTVEAMKQSLDGIQLVYELAEPIHYPLTPTEIKTLLGQNNIWSNTGDTEVEYRADTTLYINKKIAEAISALS